LAQSTPWMRSICSGSGAERTPPRTSLERCRAAGAQFRVASTAWGPWHLACVDAKAHQATDADFAARRIAHDLIEAASPILTEQRVMSIKFNFSIKAAAAEILLLAVAPKAEAQQRRACVTIVLNDDAIPGLTPGIGANIAVKLVPRNAGCSATPLCQY